MEILNILAYLSPILAVITAIISYCTFKDRRKKERIEYVISLQKEINDIKVRLAVLESNLSSHKEFADLHANEMKAVIDKLNLIAKELTE